jgi:tripartite-type tricarboxylate transporter receptor subunit TctC
VRQVGADLGVRYVLQGSVRKDGSRVRIAVQLTDALNGQQIWSERLDGDLHEVFALQDEIGTRLSARIAPALRSKFVHLPYKGGAPAMQDLLGGQIPAAISVFSNAFPHVRAGSLRALAITAPQRSPLLPNVPTAREAGYPAMEAVEWFGLFLPAKTPTDIARTLHSSVHQALQTDAVKTGLAKQSFDVAAMSQNDFVALIRADTERWGEIVKASGFKPIE